VRIRKSCVGGWETNTYVVVCAATAAAVIVDAGAEDDRVLATAVGTDPVAVIATHGHFDHVGAARRVADELAIPFRLHPADSTTFRVPTDESLNAGAMRVGELTLQVLHTPGHTPGSVCLLVDGVVISGDTLFPGGPGATTGPGADFETIMDSIETALFALPDDTIVMPGHGLDTTIGTERPALAQWRARRW
jgi:glyoxylase-like metal-dependent hydrolase (beta-lactamase superfamily II)